MNVAYVSNENYARHLGVSVCSLCDSNADEQELNIYVISTGIGERSKERIRGIAASFGRKLVFLDLRNIAARFGSALDTGRFDVSTMGRLFLGELLPETAERVLYLDCDTVVLRPLARLFGAELSGAVLGAVQEPTIYPEVKAYLGMRRGDPYFNAGVLLIDLVQWRREKLLRQLQDYYSAIAEQSLFNDQDALNGCLTGRIRSLAPKWNFFTNYRYFRYGTLCRMQPSYESNSPDSFASAKRKPAVVHFAGDERPWKAGALNYYGRAYEQYLEMTPWAGTPKEKGQELHLLLYHGMELITPVFPAIREKISHWYVKRYMRERAARRRRI